MGTIVERIREVCKEKKVAVYRLEKDLGYGNGYLNPKKATKVDSDRLPEIAEYLGVTVDYLLGKEAKKAPAENDERTIANYELLNDANKAIIDRLIADLLEHQ